MRTELSRSRDHDLETNRSLWIGRRSLNTRKNFDSFKEKQLQLEVGNEYLLASKRLTKKAKGIDISKIEQEKNINILGEQDHQEELKRTKPIYASHQILSPYSVKLQRSLLDPKRIDRVRDLRKDVSRVSDGKGYSKVRQRISLMQNQGYNDYLRAKHSMNTREYLKDVEEGDKKLIGVLNSRLNLLQRIEENQK